MDASRTTCDVLVVGAGISGLTAAYALGKQGVATVLVDAGAGPGGVIGTRERDGFLYETGANSALERAPVGRQLFGITGDFTHELFARERDSGVEQQREQVEDAFDAARCVRHVLFRIWRGPR